MKSAEITRSMRRRAEIPLLRLSIALGAALGLQAAPAWAFTTDQQEDICATPAVIACENFENRALGTAGSVLIGGKFKNSGWAVSQGDASQTVINTQAVDGTKSMQWLYPANGGAGFMDLDFSPRSSVYARWYMKVSPNWVWSGNGNKMVFVGGPTHGHNLMFDQGVFGGDTPKFIGQFGASATAFRGPNNNGTFHWPLDQWVCVESRINMNSAPAAADGSFQAWIDGTEYYTYLNQLNIDSTDTLLSLFSVSGYWNCTTGNLGGSPCDTSSSANLHPIMYRYVDNIVISTQRIGCLGTVPQPPPPPPSQSPYGGTPRAVPGRVEIEHFDEGGEGVAYHDSDAANQGGALRAAEGVDIADLGAGAYSVGWVNAGEWLEYTVNAAAGTYALNVSAASKGVGGTFHAEVDGVDVTGPLAVPDTGSWSAWRTISKTGISLTAGSHVIRLAMDANGATGAVADFDAFAFSAAAASTDLNGDGMTNVSDVQLGVNQALGILACGGGDVNKDGACNVVDVQTIANKSLGL